jgi:hypothetical protein
MDDVVLVEIVDGSQDLLDGLRGVLLGELALFANTIEELSASRELGHNVKLVLLRRRRSARLAQLGWVAVCCTYTRLEPVDELDDMRVLQPLKHIQLVIHHLLIALDVLLQDDLDGDLARGTLSLADDTIGASAEGSAEPVLGSVAKS